MYDFAAFMFRWLCTVRRIILQVSPYFYSHVNIDIKTLGLSGSYHQEHALSTTQDLSDIHIWPRRVYAAAFIEQVDRGTCSQHALQLEGTGGASQYFQQ